MILSSKGSTLRRGRFRRNSRRVVLFYFFFFQRGRRALLYRRRPLERSAGGIQPLASFEQNRFRSCHTVVFHEPTRPFIKNRPIQPCELKPIVVS